MPLLTAAAIAIGAGVGGKIFGAIKSGKQSKDAARKARKWEEALNSFKANRQDVINPYEDVTNPFANLQIASKATDFQADQTDIALSNTLDALVTGGFGGGGATAIAREAARSKAEIAANIETQEINNQKLMAQGEQTRQQLYGQGEMFKFNAQENRDNMELARLAGLGQENRRLAANYKQQSVNSWANLGSGLMQAGAGALMGMPQ